MSGARRRQEQIEQAQRAADHHDATHRSWLWLYLSAAFAALMLGALMLRELIGVPIEWLYVVGLHLLSMAVIAAVSLRMWRRDLLRETGGDGRVVWVVCLNVLVATMGPLGAFVCLAGVVAQLWFKRTAQPFEAWYSELFPEEQHDLAENLYADLTRTLHRLSGPQDVVPFIDVIRHGTRVQKQLAIGLMSRHYRREFATALKEGLADSDNSVRIQAATAIANIENRFYEQLQALRERVEEEPEAQTILALARQYDDYAFTGLLDGDREARNRDEALAGYRRYLQMQPNDVRAHMAVVRLLVKMDRAEEALLTIDGIPTQIASADELAAWRMEALYKVRRFEEIRDIARALIAAERPERPLPAVFADSVRLWAGVGPKPVEPRHAQPGLALQAGGSSP
ncbi:MAG: hypothetical protein KDK91_09880 [Gammaproteobacteria bacterium]|nr:hypothetical protein [Gammaproteobacteria bacterium]